ncbi:Hypothetical protein PSEBR_m389 [Pseudomonas brassicacearum subsp. brassicacearum NFM421]|uniref:Uncharacterized protein n=1 Tax=Pseudomonas brassicacearum (strain NFM421) TaxID=994484 RepID=F2K8I9_PSEBN|nr:Hypothetical protein PSEBR_m389 [Pseudomonas brassicacearum subsp. brassicacearum NFM421]
MAIFQMILFLMAGPMHSRLAKTTQDTAMQRHPQGHIQRQTRRFKHWRRPGRRQACPAKPGWSSSTAATVSSMGHYWANTACGVRIKGCNSAWAGVDTFTSCWPLAPR